MKQRIAYIVGRYPAVSHTFIQREVEHLRELGVSIDTFSVHGVGSENVLSDRDRESDRTTTALRPISVVSLAKHHLRALRKNPSAYVQTLKYALSRGQRDPRLALWQLFYFGEAMVLWSACEKRDIKHVHAHLANTAADVARIATFFGSATGETWSWSFTMHGPTEFFDQRQYGLKDKVKDAAFVICISDYCRSQLMALVPDDHWAKMSVVHCGVDTSAFLPTPRQHVEGDPFRVLCVGRLVPEKNQALVLDAIRDLVADGHDVHLTLVGRGPDSDHLAERVKQLGIERQVTLAGAVSQDQIRDYYTTSDAFVLASAAEGVPVVLMEAMASCVPVISTQIAGIPELIEDGVSGLLVAPGRSDAVADRIELLMTKPELRESLARAGRQKIEREFEMDDCAEQVRRVFANNFAGKTQLT